MDKYKAEEVHDQLDNMGVKILAKEHLGNTATPGAMYKTLYPQLKNLAVTDASVCNDSKTDVVKRSSEEGNWNNMSEDSSQEEKVQFFVMFTVRGTGATCISGGQHRVRGLRG